MTMLKTIFAETLRFMGGNARYAYIAMERALQDSGLKPEEYNNNPRVASIIGQVKKNNFRSCLQNLSRINAPPHCSNFQPNITLVYIQTVTVNGWVLFPLILPRITFT
jgi:3-oxoacyl-(acyl-carrier-protein) synthase